MHSVSVADSAGSMIFMLTWLLFYLGILAFVGIMLFRLVRGVERIADALERKQ